MGIPVSRVAAGINDVLKLYQAIANRTTRRLKRAARADHCIVAASNFLIDLARIHYLRDVRQPVLIRRRPDPD
jgi:hypothetical protein